MGLMDFLNRKIENIKYERLSDEEQNNFLKDKVLQEHDEAKQRELTRFWNKISEIEGYVQENKNVRLLDLIEIKPCIEFIQSRYDGELEIGILFNTVEYEYYFAGDLFDYDDLNSEEILEFLRETFKDDYETCSNSQFILDKEFQDNEANFGIREKEDGTEIAIMYNSSGALGEFVRVSEIPEKYQEIVKNLADKLKSEKMEVSHLVTKEVATEAYNRIAKLL